MQDKTLEPDHQYIRRMEEFSLEEVDIDEDDDPEDCDGGVGNIICVIVCMTPVNSQRLLRAQFVESDIAFKRVSGFLEFEIGGLENGSRTG